MLQTSHDGTCEEGFSDRPPAPDKTAPLSSPELPGATAPGCYSSLRYVTQQTTQAPPPPGRQVFADAWPRITAESESALQRATQFAHASVEGACSASVAGSFSTQRLRVESLQRLRERA
eukprot:353670-Chlamydomonas_euryale.AAC.2